MVVEHAYIRVLPGQEADFEAAFARAQPLLAAAAGCQASALFPDVERRGGYLLRVHWERLADHLEAFPRSDAGVKFAAEVAHFFDGEPEVRHFAARPLGAPS
jgi:heme-degrading monooxygenase HmoA